MTDKGRESGICECGCGQKTTISPQTSAREGIKRGQPRRFCFGHQNRRFIKNHSHKSKPNQFYHSGYVYVLAPNDHPNPTFNRYIKRSRLVVEKHLGRYLSHDEQVHHTNEIRDDDRIENLEVVSLGQHNTLHKKRRWKEEG